MKKLLFIAAISTLVVSCATLTPTSQLITTATKLDIQSTAVHTTPVVVDLQVSPNKITHIYIPSNIVIKGGEKNVINTAIIEALLNNGNADVLVGMETQIKYNQEGKIENVLVTGYPAKYVNFRIDKNYQPINNNSSDKGGVLGDIL